MEENTLNKDTLNPEQDGPTQKKTGMTFLPLNVH